MKDAQVKEVSSFTSMVGGVKETCLGLTPQNFIADTGFWRGFDDLLLIPDHLDWLDGMDTTVDPDMKTLQEHGFL